MELDTKTCYRALKSRDARFDGRFFSAVLTTGVYCRPICPARTPNPQNVQFFACSAAAEQQGFRPCLRCRPETSPGTPAWLGTSATVSRALRLIREGFLDSHDVDTLADHVGIGSRHLRRLFDEHLGASPVSVAQSRRILMAKKLIDETTLSVTEIAYASGFSSLRRFNASFQKAYRRPPRELRREDRSGARRKAAPFQELHLTYRPPFDWNAHMTFMGARALPGVESVEQSGYQRTARIGNVDGLLEVRHMPEKHQLLLRIPTALAAELPAIAERIRNLFDLRADPEVIATELSRDPNLDPLVRRCPGLRIPGAWHPFEAAVRVVIGQQISVAAARTICGRLVAKYGDAMTKGASESLHTLFPTPERLAKARMAGLGLTGKRVETVRSLARAVLGADSPLQTRESLEATVERLMLIPGIGAWTAHMIALRALQEPDAFPAGDLGLRKAWAELSGHECPQKQLDDVAERWRPWRAYATMVLWNSPQ